MLDPAHLLLEDAPVLLEPGLGFRASFSKEGIGDVGEMLRSVMEVVDADRLLELRVGLEVIPDPEGSVGEADDLTFLEEILEHVLDLPIELGIEAWRGLLGHLPEVSGLQSCPAFFLFVLDLLHRSVRGDGSNLRLTPPLVPDVKLVPSRLTVTTCVSFGTTSSLRIASS
jgi:hypothetical protein